MIVKLKKDYLRYRKGQKMQVNLAKGKDLIKRGIAEDVFEGKTMIKVKFIKDYMDTKKGTIRELPVHRAWMLLGNKIVTLEKEKKHKTMIKK